MKAITRSRVNLLLMLTLLFASGTSSAQTVPAARHTLGGFAGFTDRADADFTFGAEYEYHMAGPWSAGVLVEQTPDVIFGRDFTLLLGTAHYRPATLPRLKLTGGAGMEFKEVGGDDIRLRAGVGYDLFVEGALTVTPRLALDFGEDDESIVLGISLLYGF